MANRKVTPEQVTRIKALITQDRLKLREVKEQYPWMSLTQLHRIAVGKNWAHVTGKVENYTKLSVERVNP